MNRLRTPFVLAATLVLLLSACSLPRGAGIQAGIVSQSAGEEPSFQVVQVTRASAAQIAAWPRLGTARPNPWPVAHAAPSSAMIQSGDAVQLTIWDSQVNSLLTSEGQKSVVLDDLEVSPNGTIFVPYISEVQVQGLTPAAARERIQARLEPIVPSAQVQLSVRQGLANSIDLVGGVSAPGKYPLPARNYTILSLLAQGGGIDSGLNNPQIRLQRRGQIYQTSAERLLSDPSADIVLRGGDKVIVQQDDRAFTALGATGREAILPFPKADLTAIEALSLIGGLSDTRADPRGVLVLRDYPTTAVRQGGPEQSQVVFTMDLTNADGLFAARSFEIQPGDTVLATESPITTAQTILGLLGSALGIGRQVGSL